MSCVVAGIDDGGDDGGDDGIDETEDAGRAAGTLSAGAFACAGAPFGSAGEAHPAAEALETGDLEGAVAATPDA